MFTKKNCIKTNVTVVSGKRQRTSNSVIGKAAAGIAFLLISFVSPGMADMHSFKLLDRSFKLQEDSGDGVERGQGPAELDADEPFLRFVKDGASVVLQLDCDSEKQNYLTVKVWGGSGSSGDRLVLKDGGMLLQQRKAQPLPDRFYYATYPIPMRKTKGKSEVKVTLENQGSKSGPEVYQVYTHLGGCFEPPVGRHPNQEKETSGASNY